MPNPNEERTALPRRSGLTLLELTVTVALLALVLFSAATLAVRGQQIVDDKELYRLARQEAHNELERLRLIPFPDVARKADGRRFRVPDLPDRTGPIVEHGQVVVYLREDDAESPAFADGGFDLNGNGTKTDRLSPTDPYRVLPVCVVVTWNTLGGEETSYVLNAVLTSRTDFLRLDG